ncbi:ejaculatory bulb-specific protein 3-like [Microplitis demolitor]|uniref:ejaculatory bulb-specific protein 3-like n=1 Tax=Microplitis demolitor TaxID=69319 RepID=UPI0004CCE8A6|nr:ejaculatory bulb-specific protein 3-like [Microplitis demolitor]
MKIFVVLLLGLTLQEAIAAYQTITLPPNLDLDAMLGNDRLMRNYIQCLMDEGSCPAVVKKVKGVIISSLKNDCRNCDSEVKKSAEKMIKFLIERRPADWARLTAKYDPSGRITKKYKTLTQNHKGA